MRYFKYGAKEDAPLIDGDEGFNSLNAKLAPDLLPMGVVSKAENGRMDKGVARTREGITTPGHFNGPVTADALGNVTAWRWNVIYGSGVYSNPDATSTGSGPAAVSPEQWTVLATDTGMWVTADGFSPMSVALPAGESITGPVTFVEAQNYLLMFRGTALAPLQWAGSVSGPWEYIDSSEITNESGEDVGIVGTPNAAWAIYFNNQLVVPVAGATGGIIDQVAFSDILDFTHFNPAVNQFAINSGANEALVALVPYTQSSLVCFKERSVWILQNVYGDLTAVTLSVVSNTLGCAARNSCVQIGSDILFLCQSPAGVYRVNQVIQATTQAAPVPVSDPIAPIIKRINWKYAGNAAGVMYGDYYLLAVPLDGSTVNNAVLVYNTVGGPQGAGAWESVDTFPAVPVPPEWPANVVVSGTLNLPTYGGTVNPSRINFSVTVPEQSPGGYYLNEGEDDGFPTICPSVSWSDVDGQGPLTSAIRLEVQIEPYAGTSFLALSYFLGGGTELSTSAATLLGDYPDAIYDPVNSGSFTSLSVTTTAPNRMPTAITEWQITAWRGSQRLFGIDHGNGRVYLYGEGCADRIGAAPAAGIASSITTRGYTLGEGLSEKAMRRVYLTVSTWDPSYTVSIGTEATGVGETLATAQTRDRSKYITWGKGTWVTTNANGDFGKAGRQDYAVRCPIILQPSGATPAVRLNIEQETMERYLTRTVGRWGQVTITNDQGMLTVRGCGIEGTETARATKQTQ